MLWAVVRFADMLVLFKLQSKVVNVGVFLKHFLSYFASFDIM
jgi:hypothetical protein